VISQGESSQRPTAKISVEQPMQDAQRANEEAERSVSVNAAWDIRGALKRISFVMRAYEAADKRLRAFLYSLSPTLLARYVFFRRHGRLPDLKRPRSFDERLQWLMLHWRHPVKAQCADKYAVRSYVEAHGLGHTLPELLGVYEKSGDIDFGALPERFVLKCTHGSGQNVICTHKADLNWDDARRRLDSWMKLDISKVAGEIHYASIEPRIICERYLDDSSGDLPSDYKVYCFDGKAHCTMVCTERGLGKRVRFAFYDRDWNFLPYSKSGVLAGKSDPKPDAYEAIINAAEILSAGIPFVRVDFYSINGRAIFGEMTFTPNGCVDTDYTDLAQRELGRLVQLPAACGD
jgi:hypothetical protein